MALTLTNCMERINQALNYPALAYEDISSYFDMAISELNTTLHTSMKLISSCLEDFRQDLSKPKVNTVVLTTDPSTLIVPEYASDEDISDEFIYNTTTNKYGIYVTDHYDYYDDLYGVYNRLGIPEMYKTIRYSESIFIKVNYDVLALDLTNYLPEDWIILYLIPYVCFKYTCRDGGTGSIFSEEFTQGFQQLQDTYNVPEKILLATCSHLYAYKQEVLDNLPNLNIYIPTKAITETMKHSRQLNTICGNMYDRGGF